MKRPDRIRNWTAAARWKLLSVPIFAKTLGIGAVVAFVFGGIILYQARRSLSYNLHELLAQSTMCNVRSLAASLERPVTTGDRVTIQQRLLKIRQMLSDVRYVIVRDAEGDVVAHTFADSVPRDLEEPPQYRRFPEQRFRVLDAGPEGLIFEAASPLVGGRAGSVEMGSTESMVRLQISGLTRAILWALALSVAIGTAFAAILSGILTRPVHHLTEASRRIKDGDFDARSEIFSADEIGELASAFNEMAASLQSYRRAVESKERARIALIQKIVSSQEEERKKIARELHDGLGQSLLALMMGVQSNRKYDALPQGLRRDMEREIGDLIDELRRIVRGMPPIILDDYGLDSALADYVKEVSRRSGLEITYNYNSPPAASRLPAHIEVTLYRVAQEALTNTLRHAAASHASVVVLESPKDVTLIVEDDGKGFDTARLESSKSLGIKGMRERISLLGGMLDVESAKDEGTTIRARIPLNGVETPHWLSES